MQANQADSNPAMARLTALAGEWTQEVDVTGVPAGRTVFEWVLGGSFLLQRNEIPHTDFPDSILIIAANPGGGDLHPALLRLAACPHLQHDVRRGEMDDPGRCRGLRAA